MIITNNDFDRNINLQNKTITLRDSEFHSNLGNEIKIQKINDDKTMFDFNDDHYRDNRRKKITFLNFGKIKSSLITNT